MLIVTSGSIASTLGCDRDRVSYALRKMEITPIGTAGQVRIFPDSAIDQVRDFLKAVEVQRTGGSHDEQSK